MQKGRKKKVRYVQKMPKISQFSPRGRPGRPDEVELTVDQFEAIRLADFQSLDQSEGAQSMGISRPSFGRILREARRTVADALVNGKTIRIRIGNVQVGVRPTNHQSVSLSANQPRKAVLSVKDSAAQETALRKKILKIQP